jgi:hypothetical protein
VLDIALDAALGFDGRACLPGGLSHTSLLVGECLLCAALHLSQVSLRLLLLQLGLALVLGGRLQFGIGIAATLAKVRKPLTDQVQRPRGLLVLGSDILPVPDQFVVLSVQLGCTAALAAPRSPGALGPGRRGQVGEVVCGSEPGEGAERRGGR